MVTEKVISICLCGWIKREPTSTFYPVVNTDSLSTFRGEFQTDEPDSVTNPVEE